MKSWKLGKNLRKPDIAPLIRRFREADSCEKKPKVMFRGRVIERPRLDAYLKRKGQSEEEVLTAPDANQFIPNYIKLEYPQPESCPANLVQSEWVDTSPSTLKMPSGAPTLGGSLSSRSTRLPTPTSSFGTPLEAGRILSFPIQRDRPVFNLQEHLNSFNFNNVPAIPPLAFPQSDMPATTSGLPGSAEASIIFSELDGFESYRNVMGQMLRPDSPAGVASGQLNFFKILCGSRQVSTQALIRGLDHQYEVVTSLGAETTDPHNAADLPQRFLMRFFGGYMLHRNGSQEAACELFRHANELLQIMIENCHPECLTTLHIMLSVLEVHGKIHLAGDFLSSVLVFKRSESAHNPVAATAEFMVSVASRQVKLVEMEFARLQSLQECLQNRFGPRSPSALLGIYHVAWRAAKTEKDRQMALQILTELVKMATETLGQSHFLTISCMTTMARVVFYVRSPEESVMLMWQALQMINLRYAPCHPYRLEALYRLARILIDSDRAAESVEILREVFLQRVDIMGPKSVLTVRSLELLQEALISTGTDLSLDDLESRLLSQVNGSCENATLMAYLPKHSPI